MKVAGAFTAMVLGVTCTSGPFRVSSGHVQASAFLARSSPGFDRASYDGHERDLHDPADPQWDELIRAFSLGGAFTTTRGAKKGRREVCAPYVYAAYPQQTPPAMADGMYQYGDPWVIVHENAAAWEEPNRASRVLARLSYELVRVQGEAAVDPR